MPQFNVRAVDAQGQYQILAVEAASEDEAFARIQQRGLRVESVAPLGSGKGPISGPGPKPQAPAKQPRPATAAAAPHPSVPAARPALGRIAVFTSVVLSLIALTLAIIALVMSSGDDGLGRGLDAYDFKTPGSAYKSHLKIVANGDVRASIAWQTRVHGPRFKKQLETLKIVQKVMVKGKAVLFVTYVEDGAKQHKCIVMEKLEPSGLWNRTLSGAWSIRKLDAALARDMEAWEKRNKPDKLFP